MDFFFFKYYTLEAILTCLFSSHILFLRIRGRKWSYIGIYFDLQYSKGVSSVTIQNATAQYLCISWTSILCYIASTSVYHYLFLFVVTSFFKTFDVQWLCNKRDLLHARRALKGQSAGLMKMEHMHEHPLSGWELSEKCLKPIFTHRWQSQHL